MLHRGSTLHDQLRFHTMSRNTAINMAKMFQKVAEISSLYPQPTLTFELTLTLIINTDLLSVPKTRIGFNLSE